jgi:hypothetical protein
MAMNGLDNGDGDATRSGTGGIGRAAKRAHRRGRQGQFVLKLNLSHQRSESLAVGFELSWSRLDLTFAKLARQAWEGECQMSTEDVRRSVALERQATEIYLERTQPEQALALARRLRSPIWS